MVTDDASAGFDLRIADLPVTNPRTSEWRFSPIHPSRHVHPDSLIPSGFRLRRRLVPVNVVRPRTPKTGVLRALHVDRSHTTTANSRNPGRDTSRPVTT